MTCLPLAIHVSVSCLLGLCYGVGYVSSIASYEIYNKKKNTCYNDESKEDNKNVVTTVSVDEVIQTLETIKNELLEKKEKEIELTECKED